MVLFWKMLLVCRAYITAKKWRYHLKGNTKKGETIVEGKVYGRGDLHAGDSALVEINVKRNIAVLQTLKL